MVIVHRSYIPTYRTESPDHLRAKRRIARWIQALAGADDPSRFDAIARPA